MAKSDNGAMTLPDPDPTGRSFALLDQAERDRLGDHLRPLAWVDGLIVAEAIAPTRMGPLDDDADETAEPDDAMMAELDDAMAWLDHIWKERSEADPGNLAEAEVVKAAALATDHYLHVADVLLEDPEAWRPYLDGFSDPRQAASQWAAGFCSGVGLNAEAWEPLLNDEDAAPLLAAIFSLVGQEDLPEDIRADSPLRDLPADRLEQIRRSVHEMLPEIVRALNEHARVLDDSPDFDDDDDLGLDDDLDFDEDGGRASYEPQEPYVRAAPNEPCPCGSGKKYKKCCIDKV